MRTNGIVSGAGPIQIDILENSLMGKWTHINQRCNSRVFNFVTLNDFVASATDKNLDRNFTFSLDVFKKTVENLISAKEEVDIRVIGYFLRVFKAVFIRVEDCEAAMTHIFGVEYFRQGEQNVPTFKKFYKNFDTELEAALSALDAENPRLFSPDFGTLCRQIAFFLTIAPKPVIKTILGHSLRVKSSQPAIIEVFRRTPAFFRLSVPVVGTPGRSELVIILLIRRTLSVDWDVLRFNFAEKREAIANLLVEMTCTTNTVKYERKAGEQVPVVEVSKPPVLDATLLVHVLKDLMRDALHPNHTFLVSLLNRLLSLDETPKRVWHINWKHGDGTEADASELTTTLRDVDVVNELYCLAEARRGDPKLCALIADAFELLEKNLAADQIEIEFPQREAAAKLIEELRTPPEVPETKPKAVTETQASEKLGKNKDTAVEKSTEKEKQQSGHDTTLANVTEMAKSKGFSDIPKTTVSSGTDTLSDYSQPREREIGAKFGSGHGKYSRKWRPQIAPKAELEPVKELAGLAPEATIKPTEVVQEMPANTHTNGHWPIREDVVCRKPTKNKEIIVDDVDAGVRETLDKVLFDLDLANIVPLKNEEVKEIEAKPLVIAKVHHKPKHTLLARRMRQQITAKDFVINGAATGIDQSPPVDSKVEKQQEDSALTSEPRAVSSSSNGTTSTGRDSASKRSSGGFGSGRRARVAAVGAVVTPDSAKSNENSPLPNEENIPTFAYAPFDAQIAPAPEQKYPPRYVHQQSPPIRFFDNSGGGTGKFNPNGVNKQRHHFDGSGSTFVASESFRGSTNASHQRGRREFGTTGSRNVHHHQQPRPRPDHRGGPPPNQYGSGGSRDVRSGHGHSATFGRGVWLTAATGPPSWQGPPPYLPPRQEHGNAQVRRGARGGPRQEPHSGSGWRRQTSPDSQAQQ